MPITKDCEHCGEPFSVRPAKGSQHFCSKTCQAAARAAAHIERLCVQCGQLFVITRFRERERRFCSKACVSAHEQTHGRPAARHTRSERTTFACKHCGKTFSYSAGTLTEYRRKFDKDPQFCSLKCFGLAKRAEADARHTIPCKNCGKSFTRTRRKSAGNIYREQELCSRQCKNEWVSKLYRERNGLPQTTRRIKRGYVVIRFPASDGKPAHTKLEHRHVMEQFLGRELLPTETVHHRRAFEKTNNALDNLELRTGNHGPGGTVEDIVAWCVEMLTLYRQFLTPAHLVQLHDLIEAHHRPPSP